MMRVLVRGLVMLACLLAAGPSRAVTLGQVDDFEDGTRQNWNEGGPSPNQPTNEPNGGPGGMGDNYLRNVSTGGSGPGSRLLMFNLLNQWSGDYTAAGLTTIDMQMANFGTTPLSMRIAISGDSFSTRFGSTSAVVLPADGQWYPASFGLSASDLTRLSGGASLAAVLADVDTVRILTSAGAPSWLGDSIAAILGIDDIEAPGPGGGALPVPDGTFGSAMRASPGDSTGSVIELDWDVSTCQASEYHILFGELEDVATLTIDGGVCSLGDSGNYSWSSVPGGDLWFLVVSSDGAGTEGTWGEATGGTRGGIAASLECSTSVRDNTPTCP